MSAIGWVLLACFGFVGVLGALLFLAYRLGGADEREDQAQEDERESTTQAERMAGPMPTRFDRARAALRKLRERGVRGG